MNLLRNFLLFLILSSGIIAPAFSHATSTTAGSHYLIETDPQFANYRQWLSSDYLIERLGQDTGRVLQRLGDGFYEQKLVQDQIIAATGQRNLGDYRDNQAQYSALMQHGVDEAQHLGLTLGTALSAEQMRN